jgi:hypothetical protein
MVVRRDETFSIVGFVTAMIVTIITTTTLLLVLLPLAMAATATPPLSVKEEQQQLAGGVFFHKSANLARETIARTLLLGHPTPHSSSQDEEDASSSVGVVGVGVVPPTQDYNDKNLSYDGSDLIEWINANGGFIHANARIGLDPTGMYRGVFVKKNREHNNSNNNNGSDDDLGNKPKMINEEEEVEGIEEGDIIARIPW